MKQIILEILGLESGTVYKIVEEIKRLKRVEEKARRRLEHRVGDGGGGDFCSFCFSTYGHEKGCIAHDLVQGA